MPQGLPIPSWASIIIGQRRHSRFLPVNDPMHFGRDVASNEDGVHVVRRVKRRPDKVPS